MVEADVIERGGGGEAGDVTADAGIHLVGLDHHRQGVPAHQGTDAPFHVGVAGTAFLLGGGDGVEVGGVGIEGNVRAGAAGLFNQCFQQKMGAFRTFPFDHRVERVQPFPSFLGIHIGGLGHGVSWAGVGTGSRAPGKAS